MTDSFYLSRSFVDFGPFKKKEILDFIKRSIVLPSDFIRLELTTNWAPVSEWLKKPDIPRPVVKPKPKAAAKKKVLTTKTKTK